MYSLCNICLNICTGIFDRYPHGRYWERSRGKLISAVLSEHVDQLWSIDNNGSLVYMPEVTAARRGGKSVFKYLIQLSKERNEQFTSQVNFFLLLYISNSITEAGGGMYLQQNDCLDVGISKYGIWIVKTDNTVYFRNHNKTTKINMITTGWNLVSSSEFTIFCNNSISC